jgi:hypothetical protein
VRSLHPVRSRSWTIGISALVVPSLGRGCAAAGSWCYPTAPLIGEHTPIGWADLEPDRVAGMVNVGVAAS